MHGLLLEALEIGAPIALYGVVAILIWSAARWAVQLTLRGVGRAIDRRQLDVTLGGYVASAFGRLLNAALVVSILSM